MDLEKPLPQPALAPATPLRFGTLAHLVLFFWSLLLAMLVAQSRLWLVVSLTILLTGWLHPASLGRLLQIRWLVLALLLILVNALLLKDADQEWLGVPFSTQGLMSGVYMLERAIVILLASDRLSSSANISEVAGVLERCGLRGLGFSLGVAVNLLPNLRQSANNAWHSLRMRGGLRYQRRRALQLLLLTVIANALRRAEEIALAAETRAFTPERSRALPLKIGRYDGWITLAAVMTAIGFFVI